LAGTQEGQYAMLIGETLGPYRVLGKLGEGGMGEVYRARDTTLNRDVAIKVLPDAFAGDPDRLARFTREAQTRAALNHPNIAHIHGLEESHGTFSPDGRWVAYMSNESGRQEVYVRPFTRPAESGAALPLRSGQAANAAERSVRLQPDPVGGSGRSRQRAACTRDGGATARNSTTSRPVER
jgi:hypothetical protein